jgi:hypothetical protein
MIRMDDSGEVSTIAQGQEKKPLVQQHIELGQKADNYNQQQAIKYQDEIIKRKDSGLALLDAAERIDEQLSMSKGESSVNLIGKVAKAADVIVSNARSVATELGVDLDAKSYADVIADYPALATQNAAVQSNIISLAFQIARANNNEGKPSNADMENAIRQIGGTWTTPPQIRAAMNEIVNRVARDIDFTVENRRDAIRSSLGNVPTTFTEDATRMGLGKNFLRPNRTPSPATGRRASESPVAQERLPGPAPDNSPPPPSRYLNLSPTDINGMSREDLYDENGRLKINPAELGSRQAKEALLRRLKALRGETPAAKPQAKKGKAPQVKRRKTTEEEFE